MKIMVTGFQPFGGEAINSALEAMNALPDVIADAAIIKVVIPTVFDHSAAVLKSAVLDSRPDMLLCIGQAGGRNGITPERIAINQDDARIADNEGKQPIDRTIQPDGPAAYFSTLPIKAIVKRIQQSGLPASVSNSAGTFVCNHLMYQALYLAEQEWQGIPTGFIHVPLLPEQTSNKPNLYSMSLEDLTKGLIIAIETMVLYDQCEDLPISGGATH